MLLQRLRRTIYLRLNEAHQLAPADHEVDMARQFVEEHLSDAPRRRLFLRPSLPPEQAETGPPCPACGVCVTQAMPLVGCAACLEVFHQGCWTPGAPCVSERCGGPRSW